VYECRERASWREGDNVRILFAALLFTLTGCADLLPGTYDADLVITQTGTSELNSTMKGTLTILLVAGGYEVTLEPTGSPACHMDAVKDAQPDALRLTSQSTCTIEGVKDTVKTGSGSASGDNATLNISYTYSGGTGTISTTGTRRK
jgi:hypothetical protein